MTAELSARPKGTTRHPWDWYVEEKWVTYRLLDMIALESDVTYLARKIHRGLADVA